MLFVIRPLCRSWKCRASFTFLHKARKLLTANSEKQEDYSHLFLILSCYISPLICSFKSCNLDLNCQCPAFDLCNPFASQSGPVPNGIKAFGCCTQNEEQPPSLLQVSHWYNQSKAISVQHVWCFSLCFYKTPKRLFKYNQAWCSLHK